MGCVGQAGEQSQNVARNAILASRRLPESVPGVSVDRQCGSSQQALHFAAALVKSGVQDIVIAAGVEHMTRVPMFFSFDARRAGGIGSYHQAEGIRRRYPDILFRQFTGAEGVDRKYELNKEDLRSNCCCRFNRESGYRSSSTVWYCADPIRESDRPEVS